MSFVKFLYDRGIIDHDLYEIALGKEYEADDYILEVLRSSGDFCDEDIISLRSEFWGLGYTDLKDIERFDNLNYKELESVLIIPFKFCNGEVHAAISNPDDVIAKNTLSYNLSLCEKTQKSNVVYYIASKERIKQKFREFDDEGIVDVSSILYSALNENISDIHITPYERTFKIQFRCDGELRDYKTLDIGGFDAIKNSIKVLSKLDISETRRPQSGSFQENQIDFRVSTHPTIHGENIVIRILNRARSLISIEKLGFNDKQISYLKRICRFSNGLIIFCGPTGSGKTTSIYSLIETMDKRSRNIMTLEDPIEYKISNARQTEIIPGIIDFATGMKSILRQDPDVILIGEIRDEETAQMTIRASMTGHLVFTTIHANDCFGAISRLEEFGISSSLIAENLIAIISQRLVKKKLGRGRIIVSEILEINEAIKSLIFSRACKTELIKAAKLAGFCSLEEDCVEKIHNNIISESDVQNILRT